MKRLDTLFLQEKPAGTLLFVKASKRPTYATIIAKEIGATYAHTFKVLSKLEDLGLVCFERIGRIKLVILTELGKETAEALERFNDLVRLSEIGAKIERVNEKWVRGRPQSEIDKAAVSKHLAPYRRELERFAKKSPELKEQSKKLMKRIDEISEGATAS